jgi:hypothetical protein
MDDLECPYCGHWGDVCHDDGFGYEEGEKHEMQCRECEKSFVFYTSISYDYEPEKADCLNDGKHEIVEQTQDYDTFILTHSHCKTCDNKNKRTYVNKEPRG